MHVCWTAVEFVEVETLLLAVHYFRHKDDVFYITLELKIIAAATFVQSIADFYKLNETIYLVQCARDIVVLTASNLMPILYSWHDPEKILPTPEMLESFELTLSHVKALKAFRRFLMHIPATGSITGVETSSARPAEQYLMFIVDSTDVKTRKIREKVREIEKKYIVPGLFTQELRQRTQEELAVGREVEAVTAALAPLMDFARDKLEHEYFPLYKKSEAYLEIYKETEQFLRLRQRESSLNQLL